ncbi:restriction endonuclease subunit S [uncultured Eubacterium sp.]|uniref:restriction endonuclease subunit S n=1 Tax=uncultured Eubacterium sp. TaxID=165185 RepID=UPI002597D550|nr:restriction endonuclease subunit S [uncultured Eubacterium sp.]
MAVLRDYIKIKHGFAFKGDHILTIDNGIVLVTPGNFSIGGGFKEEKCKFFYGEYPVDYVLKPGDLIVTMTDLSKTIDTLGYSALVPNSERTYLHNQRIGLVQIIDDERLDKHYLYWFMRTPYYQKTIAATSSGSTVHHTSPDRIMDIEIEVPDLKKQRSVAMFMDNIESKINTNKQINENLVQQVTALYIHLLQKSEWPVATILDIAKKVAMGPFGSNIKVSTFVSEGVPVISGNHLRGYFLEEPEFNYITEEHAKKLKNSIVFPHDLIFTHAGNIGQVAMIPDGCKYDRYVLSQRQFYLRCDETKVLPEFLLMFFHSTVGQHELLSYANQTGVPSIAQPATNLKKIPFKCPPLQEQLIWRERAHPMLELYLNNRLENERLSALRDAILPKLMSGKIDVSELDL